MKQTIYNILGSIALLALPVAATAQKQAKDSTVSRTVIVEQQYNPDIMDASKVNALPKVEPPTVSKKTVEYDATLAPAGDIPATSMQAYTGKEALNKALPGYVRLGYGMNGNLDARANYLFTLPNSDKLNLTLHATGMNGKLDMPQSEEKWKSRYYRTHTGLDYVHAFRKIDLNVAGNFGVSNFNYLPESAYSKQKFLSGDVHFGVKSTSDELPLQFYAETNLLFYERQHLLGSNNAQEGMVRTKAFATGNISEAQRIGMGIVMNNAFYKKSLYEDYTSLQLNPHYLYDTDDWKIRLGAHVDLSFGFGKQFRVAPDLSAQYIFSDSYILYAQATGGKQLNDFRRLETICPYGEALPLDATYEQLNGALGFKASPVSGLWFNLYGGYQDLKNDVVQAPANNGADLQMLALTTTNTHNVYAGAEVRYGYKDIISFSASGIYRRWSLKDKEKESTYLRFKPAFEADLHIEIRPISPVLVSLGYNHITRENIEEGRANAVSNLYLNGSYEVFKGISIYARVNNLLNKQYQYYWGYPTEGINFLGGASFRF